MDDAAATDRPEEGARPGEGGRPAAEDAGGASGPPKPPAPPKKPRRTLGSGVGAVALAGDGTVLAVLAELVAEAVTVPDDVAKATAAAPVPVPRMTARPAAVLVRRERRGLRGRSPLPGGVAPGGVAPGGGGVNG